MATINVKATVSAPSEINIPLVRADHHAMSNVFRVFFEVFLACSSTTLGAVVTMTQPMMTVHWVLLIVFALSTAAFLTCFFYYGKPPRNDAKQNDKG